MVSSNMFLITFVTLITTALGTTTIIISASPSVSVTPSSGNTSAQSSVGVMPSASGNTVQSATTNNNQSNTIVPSASGNPGQSATSNNNQGNNMPSASDNPGQSATSNNNQGNNMPSASGNPGQSATASNNPGNTIMPSGSSSSLPVSSVYFNLSDPAFVDKFLQKDKHLFSELSCTNQASCCEGKGNSTIKVKVKDCNKNFPGHCNVNSTFEVKEKLCLDVTMIPCCSRAAFLNTSLVFIFLGLFLHLVGN